MVVNATYDTLLHAAHVARTRGPREFAERGLRRVLGRIGGPSLGIDLHAGDLMSPIQLERRKPVGPGEAFCVGMVMPPPSARSGGHQTLMRLLERMEWAGMDCSIYLYDFFGDDTQRHVKFIRSHYPTVRAPIHDARRGIADHHAVIATSWETAQIVARSPARGRRFYLVQDFEPWFSGRGTAFELARQTYTFGFHGIAIGPWLPTFLETTFGMTCDSFPFACDTSKYTFDPRADRRGIAFYARPSTPRRAFGLGMLTLSIVHRERPEIPINLFGERTGWTAFPVVDHGTLKPDRLNDLYNGCRVGLALSMTNVSLVPWEMLASGCIPVVNSLTEVRASLGNPHVRYADATPEALAATLLQVYDETDEGERYTAASSVESMAWSESGDAVVAAILREVNRDAS